MLSRDEAKSLISCVDTKKKLFENLNNFHENFTGSLRIKACCSLVFLLKYSNFLSKGERAVSLYLLYELSFICGRFHQTFLHELVDGNELDEFDKALAIAMMNYGVPAHLKSMTIEKLLESFNFEEVKAVHSEFQKNVPLERFTLCGFSECSLFVPDKRNGVVEANDSDEELLNYLQNMKHWSKEPPWCRPRPPEFSVDLDDMKWMNLGCHTSVDMENSELLASSFVRQLSPVELERVQTAVLDHPLILLNVDIDEDALINLSSFNHSLAVTVLPLLVNVWKTRIDRYFDVIMGMELNLQTLELANKFLRNVEIPEEFAQKMATKFVAECRRSKDLRSTKLVFMVFGSLLQHNVKFSQETIMELETFCLEFPKLRESRELYQILKKCT